MIFSTHVMSNSANSGINPFEVALTQLDEVSSMIGLDKGLHQFLAQPKRVLTISVPVKMDDGTIRTIQGRNTLSSPGNNR